MNELLSEIGIAGLDSLGERLALNIADHGYQVAVYDSDEAALAGFRQKILQRDSRRIQAAETFIEFVSFLKVPRNVLIAVPAGFGVNEIITELNAILSAGDLIIDAGNSYFKDTDARSIMLGENGIELLGVGLAGRGRSTRLDMGIMAGGSERAYQQVRNILEGLAPEVNGEPCVKYLGPGSAGHYVEMVYSGIEQSVIQLIAEAYCLMSRVLGLSDAAVQEVFALWSESEVGSSLLATIALTTTTDNGGVIETMFDLVGEDSTKTWSGKWASLEARDLNVGIPTIDVALAIRMLSSLEEGRSALRRLFIRRPVYYVGKLDILIEQIKRALYAGMIMAFAQGLDLLRVASRVYTYELDLEAVARIWRGSIIRSPLLQDVCDALYLQPHLPTLLSDPQFAHSLQMRRGDLRDVVRLSVEHGIPAPALTASLVYYDAHRRLDANEPGLSAEKHAAGLKEAASPDQHTAVRQ